MTDKICAAIGCGVPITATQFACPRHWTMIPRYLRVNLWAARHGSGPTPRSLDAGRRAVLAIAEQEGLEGIATLRFALSDGLKEANDS
jgi:hypothetical protein